MPRIFERFGNNGLPKGNASGRRAHSASKDLASMGRSGGGAPVVGSDGKPIADRTAMRRNAG